MAASPDTVFDALVDQEKLARWLPPAGMRATIRRFEPWPGGGIEMVLSYEAAKDHGAGKTSANEDVLSGRFLEIDPGSKVVQAFDFRSDDPRFAGTMRMTWRLEPVPGGTLVSVAAEDVPQGIAQSEHQAAMAESLANLAAELGCG